MSLPEANPSNNKTNAFWSPMLVFLLGPGAAALNWWRMGWKHKTLACLGITVLVNLFYIWSQQGKPLTASTANNNFLLVLSLLVLITYNLILVLITNRDIRIFNHSGANTQSVHWIAFIIFNVTTLLISVSTVLAADSLASTTKHCRFPRLRDLIYENEINSRSGLRTLLINHMDFDCAVAWSAEFEGNPSNQAADAQPLVYGLAGYLSDEPTSTLILSHYVDVYQEPITFLIFDLRFSQVTKTNINLEIPKPEYANFYRSSCFETEPQSKQCILMLGYEHVLTWFSLLQEGSTESEFIQIISRAVTKVDQRIYDYEKNTLLVDR